MRRAATLLAAGALGATAGAAEVGAQEAPAAVYLTPRDSAAHIHRGEHSGLPDALRLVVRDSAAWAAAWRQVMLARPEGALPPAVDFRREMVVVAALGLRAAAGHAIAVDSARRAGAEIEVVVRSVAPGARCAPRLALVQPVDVVRLPRSERAVRFAERTDSTVTCPAGQ